MAVTAASLKADHEEFDSLADAVVTRYIAQAERRHDATVWGTLLDDGVMLYACDQMARSPYCSKLRLVSDGRTLYQDTWESLRRQVGAAYRVLPE